MKEIIDLSLLQEAQEAAGCNERVETEINAVHCSMCTNCSGIVGD